MLKKKLSMITAMFTAAALFSNVPTVLAYDDLTLVKECGRDYGYNYLAKCSNADGRQKLYNEIYDLGCEIWQSDDDYKLDSDGNCIIAVYNAEDYGLSTYQDVLEVYLTMKHDNPILYFMSNHYMYTDKQLYILMDEEYISGDVRKAAQDDIYNYVLKTSEEFSSASTIYDKTKLMHDKLIEECEYELEPDGKTPSKRHAAHNILGMIEDGSGVCDSYASTFSLIMNYEDIDCLFISGDKSGTNHAWDMVKLDDGNYYYFDCSLDENFSKIDELPQDFFLAAGSEKISILHTPDTPSGKGRDFLYELPEVGEADYSPLNYIPDDSSDASQPDISSESDVSDAPPPEIVSATDNSDTSKPQVTSDSENSDASKPDVLGFMVGDVNGDGNIDIEDAVMVINHVNGVKVLTNDESERADIDGNNEIDIEDAVRIISYINGVSTF